MKKLLGVLVVLFIIATIPSLPLLGPNWTEVHELTVLRENHSSSDDRYCKDILLFENGPKLTMVLSCGGGSNQYCSMRLFQNKERLLSFSGNCDTFFTKPRIWMEDLQATRPRRFLTYHELLVNGDSAPQLTNGGYWLWEWDGKAYKPTRRTLQPLLTRHKFMLLLSRFF